MHAECEYILSSAPSTLSFEKFMADETLKRAIVRSLEIIGEASKKIPVDVKLKWNEIEWKSIAGMRDRLIHDYMGVNYTIVWDVVQNRIPQLHETTQRILGQKQLQRPHHLYRPLVSVDESGNELNFPERPVLSLVEANRRDVSVNPKVSTTLNQT